MAITKKRKIVVGLIADTLSIILGACISQILLNYYVTITSTQVFLLTGVYILTFLGISLILKNYLVSIRSFNFRDIKNIIIANIIAMVFSSMIHLIMYGTLSQRFVYLLVLNSFIFMLISRITWRLLINEIEIRKNSFVTAGEEKKRTLLIGGGRAGRIFIENFNHSKSAYKIVGILDDDQEKIGTKIAGIKILSSISDLENIVNKYHIGLIMITALSIPGEKLEQILDFSNQMGVKVNQMPEVEKTLMGYQMVGKKEPKEIEIADLLGRNEVKLDDQEVLTQISNRTVLVTGAGGSIGSEICRQLIKFSPKKIYLLGHGENSIYLIHQELRQMNLPNTEIIPVIADVQDKEHIHDLMQNYKPDIVYHAAAHKHVPLMEANPTEAIKNNIYGTYNVAQAAKAANVEVFVMVSTDKANNPPNIMGASKRIAEMIVTGMNEPNQTIFSAVRFGNVLGSRGSVIPLFKKQIAAGGPVTVTDFNMRRYFMTIPEASRLVIQAGALAQGGEIFILDMGKEVYILDLAKKMIKLSGFTEEEIGIIETGIRPGEKLYEELLLSDEMTGRKVDNKIFIGKIKNKSIDEIEAFLTTLDTSGRNNEQLKEQVINYVQRVKNN